MVEALKPLAVFAKAVECGSFRQAARQLGLSPSVVSHHVTALEARLSVALLYRSTRRLALTPAGETMYDAAREMLAAAGRALDAVGPVATPTGRLRITAPALLVGTSFGADLAAFAAAHPKVALSVAFTEQRLDLLRDGLDVALRIGRLEDSTLKARRLAVMRRVLVAAPAYVAARARPRAIGDLAAWDHLQLASRPPVLALVPPRRRVAVTLPYAPRVTLDSAIALRDMAVAGIGVTSLPELLARDELARDGLVEVLPGWRLPGVDVYAVWPGGATRPQLTLRFVDFVGARLAALFGHCV